MTVDRPLHCPLSNLVLKPLFIHWLFTQHETALVLVFYYSIHFIFFVIVFTLFVLSLFLLLMYTTLCLLRLFLKCFINKVEFSAAQFEQLTMSLVHLHRLR